MYRGLVHFHSNFSYDSISSIDSIVSFAINNKLNFLILTDHDEVEGAKALKEYISKKKLEIEVVIAAEYKTDLGDVIAIGIKSQIKNMKFELFVNEVRAQGGLIFFPHPYIAHKEVERIASVSDMIEAFNARVSDELNYLALELAERHNKPIYFASDAHSISELKNSIIEFKKNGDVVNSLLNSKIKRVTAVKTLRYKVILSQLIKAYKKRDIMLLISNLISAIKNYSKLKEGL